MSALTPVTTTEFRALIAARGDNANEMVARKVGWSRTETGVWAQFEYVHPEKLWHPPPFATCPDGEPNSAEEEESWRLFGQMFGALPRSAKGEWAWTISQYRVYHRVWRDEKDKTQVGDPRLHWAIGDNEERSPFLVTAPTRCAAAAEALLLAKGVIHDDKT